MELAVEEAQQGVETAATEAASQQITPAQIAALAQVTDDRQHQSNSLILAPNTELVSCEMVLHQSCMVTQVPSF